MTDAEMEAQEEAFEDMLARMADGPYWVPPVDLSKGF